MPVQPLPAARKTYPVILCSLARTWSGMSSVGEFHSLREVVNVDRLPASKARVADSATSSAMRYGVEREMPGGANWWQRIAGDVQRAGISRHPDARS